MCMWKAPKVLDHAEFVSLPSQDLIVGIRRSIFCLNNFGPTAFSSRINAAKTYHAFKDSCVSRSGVIQSVLSRFCGVHGARGGHMRSALFASLGVEFLCTNLPFNQGINSLESSSP